MPRSHRLVVLLVALVDVLGALTPAPARAMHAAGQSGPVLPRTPGTVVSFSIGASVGVVEGAATERAFDYPYNRKFKLSELTWDLKDVVMAGVHGSMEIGRRFRLNLGVWSALTDGNGTMVDRDWDYPDSTSAWLRPDGSNWTHESRHPDTSLDKGRIADLNLSVLALQTGPFSLRGIVGYKNDVWNWSARGGSYVYSDRGFRDSTGTFPKGAQVITYEQQYSIPYIGVGANWSWPSVQVESHLLVSPAVSASDSDYHVLRGVLFEADYSGGTYLGLGLNATWMFARHWSAALGVEYQWIPEITGDTAITGEEGNGFFADGSGITMNATSVTLGAGYCF